jgi:hypothetical protein
MYVWAVLPSLHGYSHLACEECHFVSTIVVGAVLVHMCVTVTDRAGDDGRVNF